MHDPLAEGYLGEIDWDWLARQPALHESSLIRHVRLKRPLVIKVDGRTGRGARRTGRR